VFLQKEALLHPAPRFQVLTAAGMKMPAFWDIAPFGLVGVHRIFRGAFYLHHHVDVRTSETSVYCNETALLISQKALIFALS
jgi:hypothetical protein